MARKVGDIVTIKSLDWYNKNKNEHGEVDCLAEVFTSGMRTYCGTEATIIDVHRVCGLHIYDLDITQYAPWAWDDEMFED